MVRRELYIDAERASKIPTHTKQQWQSLELVLLWKQQGAGVGLSMLATIAFMLRQSRRQGICLLFASALGPRDGSLKVYYGMKSTKEMVSLFVASITACVRWSQWVVAFETADL